MKTLIVTTTDEEKKKFVNTDELEHIAEIHGERLEIKAGDDIVAVFDGGMWRSYVWESDDSG